MKKGLIYGGATVLVAAGVAGLAVLNRPATAEPSLEGVAVALADVNLNNVNGLKSKDETVYVVADANGETKKTFVGNTLNNGNESLPFELSIRYYLDGAEIAPSELAGKSGHVKIVFSYDATAYYNGRKVPFLAVSGAMLDETKFLNVTVENGRVLDDGSRMTVVGYALVGLNDDLGTDFLPDEFTLEADVKGFELPVTYTLLTNEVFGEIDTSKLSSVDDLIASANELSDGLSQIIDGAENLEDGLESLVAKSGELKTGAEKLSYGLNEKLVPNNAELKYGATLTFNSILETVNAKIAAGTGVSIGLTIENYEATLTNTIATLSQDATTNAAKIQALTEALTQLKTYDTFYSGLNDYLDGVAEAADGAAELAAKMPALIEGETKLYNGAVELKGGLDTFKTSGIDKLVSFANQDLEKFLTDFRGMVAAAKSYRHYQNVSAESVKFIVKTSSVK